MKIIVTHNSPDWDGITAIWFIRKFLSGWENPELKFVPAGERISSKFKDQPFGKTQNRNSKSDGVIEVIGEDEIIHVDTGLGLLDHHHTPDTNISAASLTWEFIKVQNPEFSPRLTDEAVRVQNEKIENRKNAIERIVKVVTEIDHFKEVFWKDPSADYHEFSLTGVLEGLKLQKQGEDKYYVDFGIQCLDAIFHNFENRIWAEKEIKEKGRKFKTKWGEALGIETINDSVLKLAQKEGYVLVVRKDPRKGYVRIKARPLFEDQDSNLKTQKNEQDIDLTNAYEKLKKIDPEATWFLHVSKKMLLNGTPKNPKMKPTSLTLEQLIKVLETI